MFSARGAHGRPCEREACTIREACTLVFHRGGKNGSNLGDILNQECGEGDLSGNGSTVVISRYTFDFYIFISEEM